MADLGHRRHSGSNLVGQQPALTEHSRPSDRWLLLAESAWSIRAAAGLKDTLLWCEVKPEVVYDEAADLWGFSVVDVVQVLTQQADFQTARKYWNQLKRRLEKEGSQSVTACHRLKLPAASV